ncbi:MAG: restriction endonuclease subunit R [Leptolyngbya sp. PLA2]|nr:restriction endonuclease subunit R [Leptolyngbya sp.]MCE7972328.1 restriction endonuclease subunit R [Leptolyngbya sp. PL-A2]MCQ3939480.1 restriction endonuclease subunit R [cyanobacterium CYA1]MCZ7632264.1 DEAD/DEAH box helicase family protein [Phycisphaerales bacterium]MDL1903738.1 restriction endonuclease subunit R [Synechococcales cyanobacterium CNB]
MAKTPTPAADAREEAPLNLDAVSPLYAPWEEPTAHRGRAEGPGKPAPVIARRRPSKLPVVNTLRDLVREWRECGYPGASTTTRTLLHYWFERSHRVPGPDGDVDFRYYYCQREAVETLIYLKEVRRTDRVSQILAEYGGPLLQTAALGVPDGEDAWGRAAFKMATGSGKTKAMALCIAWSYFHALFESDSPMAKHFVLIAPGLTVYERLKDDFGGGRIFDPPPRGDPIVPPEWRGDWNISVVEQDAAGGAATGGVIYLTNIHRLYDPSKRRGKKEAEYHEFMGPSVSKASALDVGAALRDRITAHKAIMVLNDEAHHVWDPDSAWNEAIEALHRGCQSRGGAGIVQQLDFSATPKDNEGNLFRHCVCDTPLGEAVDGGIVKFPIIGKASKLAEGPHKDAGYKYDMHLRLGYNRWKAAQEEWSKVGRKALMFVMCESTDAADQITRRLNDDPENFPLLKGRTINLHTNLKGRIVMRGSGENRQPVFEEKESEISEEDLKALRKLSRELDSGESPYLCIVSVMMLREGWDVRNVTTIVPLRKYSAESGILAEQTLGRGLRRMTGPGTPGGTIEAVTVIDHPAFAELYREELEQEGVIPEIVDAEKPQKTTVDIFVDPKKDAAALDIVVPQLSAGFSRKPVLEPPTMSDVKAAFGRLQKLPIDSKTDRVVDFEGRSLTTGEILTRLRIDLPQMATGAYAITYYVGLIEAECKVQGLFKILGSLIQSFIEEVLFEQPVSLYDDRIASRLADPDVVTHVLHVFVPMVRERTIQVERRAPELPPMSLKDWKPYKASHSERNPCRSAQKTMFNLVPCRGGLEAAIVPFLDLADNGVVAFAKNAGPQALRIDYVRANGQLSTYAPDFFVRGADGTYWLVETKGREDADVPRKAKSAIAWCEEASKAGVKWSYLFVPQNAVEAMSGGRLDDLVRACAPALQTLVQEREILEQAPLFAEAVTKEARAALPPFIDQATMDALPEQARKAAEEAILMFEFLSKREGSNLAPAFTSLLGQLDSAAKAMVLHRLGPFVPGMPSEQRAWFEPYISGATAKPVEAYKRLAQNIRKTILYSSGLMPLGMLRDCLDFALNDNTRITGVFEAIRQAFRFTGSRKVLEEVNAIYDFRNQHVAHQEVALTEVRPAAAALGRWIRALALLLKKMQAGPSE